MIQYCQEYWDDVDQALKCVPNLEELADKSILVTGATGMICSSIVELLLRYNLKTKASIKIILAGRSLERVCCRFTEFQNGKDFYFVNFDATSGDISEVNVDYIIYGASNANPAIFAKEPVETILANIIGLNSLLSMAVIQKSERALYISSSEVYGNKDEQRPYHEDDYGFVDILNPRSCYPCSKRAAETLCIAYGQEYGLDTVIVRPGHIYGPSITKSDSRASAQFTRNVAKGEDIILKSIGSQLRSYCYTLDCASAILTVLLTGEKWNAYNISNKESVVTISDIANAFAKTSGRKVIYSDSSEQEKLGYNLMDNSSLDATKLEKLGWKAFFKLSEGVERTIRFYKP